MELKQIEKPTLKPLINVKGGFYYYLQINCLCGYLFTIPSTGFNKTIFYCSVCRKNWLINCETLSIDEVNRG